MGSEWQSYYNVEGYISEYGHDSYYALLVEYNDENGGCDQLKIEHCFEDIDREQCNRIMIIQD